MADESVIVEESQVIEFIEVVDETTLAVTEEVVQIVSEGIQGPQGIQGPRGEKGEQGDPAQVTLDIDPILLFENALL